MKILITVEFYWPHLGGAEEVAGKIAEGLVARGHEVHVATSVDSARGVKSRRGVTIHEFAVQGNEVKGFKGRVGDYLKFLGSFTCDALLNYAAQSWTTDLAMRDLDSIPATRKLLAPCGYSGLSTPLRRFFYRRYYRALPARLRKYDLIIYHSANFRDAYFGRRHGVRHQTVIPNGVDLKEFSRPTGQFRQHHDLATRLLVVNVSNHYQLKGHERLFRLAEGLSDLALVVLLGRDIAPRWQSCYGQCQRRAKKANVLMLDGNRGQVINAILDADIFVLTSRSEVAPLVLLEAAAAGVPWVSFDVGNVRELEGGIVVQNDTHLLTALKRLVAQPGERRRVGAAGRRFAETQSWERQIDKYETALLG